jgi:hypothetical protein
MIIKYILRFVFKVVATPFFIMWIIPLLVIGKFFMFHDWLYDKNDWDKSITRETHHHFVDIFKKWFTRL